MVGTKSRGYSNSGRFSACGGCFSAPVPSTFIIEERVKILETYPKSEEI